MRKLIYFVASTIDGFVADPARNDPSDSVFDVSGTLAAADDGLGWLIGEYPEMVPRQMRPAIGMSEDTPNRHFDTVVEGRVSYQNGVELGVDDAYPHLHHLVFSRTLTEVPGAAVELVTGDPVAAVRDLKSQPGRDIWLVGGGSLAGALRDEIDEIHLKLNPVVVGSGTPLIDAGFQVDRYELTDHRLIEGGVAFLTYRRRR